jgi:uncharacterized protein (TIGR02246 family)
MRYVGDEDGISEVRDALAIRALCERYAQAVDLGDGAALASVFTADGHLSSDYYGRHYSGREELARIPEGAKSIAPTTMHFVGNHIAEISGDTATGVTYCMAHHLRTDHTDLVMAIRYVDAYVRGIDGAWLIADRHVGILWTETHETDRRDA